MSSQPLSKSNRAMSRKRREFTTTGVVVRIQVDWFGHSQRAIRARQEVADALAAVLAHDQNGAPSDIRTVHARIAICTAAGPRRTEDAIVVFDNVVGGLRLTAPPCRQPQLTGRIVLARQPRYTTTQGEKSMVQEKLIQLTADIVAAHVANNTVAVGDVGTLVQRVHGALAGLSELAAPEEQVKSPVVSVRASIKPDYLVCMKCGRKQKTLKRHLATAHGMTPAQYRKDYGLPDNYPMVAANYSEQRREMAKSIGLGRKAEPAEAAPVPGRTAKPVKSTTSGVGNGKSTGRKRTGRPRSTTKAAESQGAAQEAPGPENA
jgi:predicted transcriptional regulator